MKKHALFFILIFLASKHSAALAQSAATPDSYQITITEVKLCSDVNCTASSVLGNKNMTLDLADGTGGVGAAARKYVDTSSVTPGTYTHARITLANAVRVLGSVPGVTGGGGTVTCNTSTAGVADNGFGDNIQINAPSGTAGLMTYVVKRVPPGFAVPPGLTISGVPGSFVHLTYQLPGTLVMNQGDALPRVNVTFTVTNALHAEYNGSNCIMYIMPPVLDITAAP